MKQDIHIRSSSTRLRPVAPSAILLFLCAGFALTLFPSGTHAAWYDSGYGYCRELTTTAGGNVGGVATTTSTGFALVATSTMASFALTDNGGNITQTTTASGTTTPVDVVVTNGTECTTDGGSVVLDFYFEKYVAATGEFVLWIEPSAISSTTSTTVLMYYGNPLASDLSNEAGVFGALGESAVWNLHEDPSCVGSCVLDSTTSNADGDAGTSMTAANLVAGYLDGALDFEGASNDNVAGNPAGVLMSQDSSFTVMAWFKIDSFPAGGSFETMLAVNDEAGNDEGFWFQFSGNDLNCGWQNGSDPDHNFSTQNLSTGVWYHGVCSFTDPGDNVTLYTNGASVLSEAEAGSIQDDLDGAFSIGSDDATNGLMDGILDDLRIFNARTLHSMDILTIYNNTRSSAIFWTFGGEETQIGGGGSRVVRLLGNVRLRGVRLLGL